MGYKLYRKEICGKEQIKPNEEKDICIELEKEERAAIHGIVKFPSGRPVEGAVVKLFRKKDPKDCCDTCELIPVTFTFTDECGQFLFGVCSNVDYIIKVFFYKPEVPVIPCEKHEPCERHERCED